MMNTECPSVAGPIFSSPAQRISYTPNEAAVATGRSRSRIFKAIKDKELVAKKDGRATLIEAEELRRWVRDLPAVEVAA
jgi:excisionase family DNA binding protein